MLNTPNHETNQTKLKNQIGHVVNDDRALRAKPRQRNRTWTKKKRAGGTSEMWFNVHQTHLSFSKPPRRIVTDRIIPIQIHGYRNKELTIIHHK